MGWVIITFIIVVIVIEVIKNLIRSNRDLKESRIMEINAPIGEDEIAVVVTGTNGKQFRRDWKARANRVDAIGWTLLYDKDFHFDKIAKVEVFEGTVNE